jgi:hypothetical protein
MQLIATCPSTTRLVTLGEFGNHKKAVMTQFEQAAAAGSYEPAAIYYADSDCVEYVKSDSYFRYERIDEFLTLIKDSTGHTLVGFKLKGFRNMFERLKSELELSDKQFLPLVSAIEKVYSMLGNSMFPDEKRAAAYKAAYRLAKNDNVYLGEAELLAA